MMSSIPPGVILIVGALFFPLLKGRLRQVWLLGLPVLSFLHMMYLKGQVDLPTIEIFGYSLELFRMDKLAMVWGYVFHIALFCAAIFALHVDDSNEHLSAISYAGAAIGAVFAGDLITLFIYWELTAVTSVFLVWAGKRERSYRAGMRYLIIQVLSGVILLAGILLRVSEGKGIAFNLISDTLNFSDLSSTLILLAFGIKAAFPLLHNWLTDAYPEATPTGTVFLSTFTTKLAIYALARGFAGTDALMWVGGVMVAFPIFFAVIENDLRRVLAYSLNNQLGYMVVGVGIGTPMAINGTAAHAFAHIIYKGLLFMSMGAVLHRTGTAKGSELGGLFKTMPWTMLFCCIGAASISGFPGLSGFTTKSMIIDSTAIGHYAVIWLLLLFGSAGVFHHSGIKIPFFAFFAHDSGKRPKEAPWNMLLAMGIMSALCIGIGAYPKPLYDILPHAVNYQAYTGYHVVAYFQLLFFSALAFTVLKITKIYPPELKSTNLDTDWVYRKAGPGLVAGSIKYGGRIWAGIIGGAKSFVQSVIDGARQLHGPGGILARTWHTGSMVIWVAVMLGVLLTLYFLR